VKRNGGKLKPALWAAIIAVLCAPVANVASVAEANNTQTINSSDGPLDTTIVAAFTPSFVQTQCSAMTGATGNCSAWGTMATTAASSGGGFFNNSNVMPVLNFDVWSGGIASSGWKNQQPFSSGLMSWDRSDGSSYFAGLDVSWTGYSDAANNPTRPMGVPVMPNGAESVREQWVDQTIISWTETLDNLGDPTQIGNFRSRLSWMGSDVATSWAHIDQRWETLVKLDPNGLAFNASRQTMQSAFAVGAPTGANPDPNVGVSGEIGVNPAGWPDSSGIGQLITQDVAGWFTSCISCDPQGTLRAAFTPMAQSLTFMPFDAFWINVPSISHGSSSGNTIAAGF